MGKLDAFGELSPKNIGILTDNNDENEKAKDTKKHSINIV